MARDNSSSSVAQRCQKVGHPWVLDHFCSTPRSLSIPIRKHFRTTATRKLTNSSLDPTIHISIYISSPIHCFKKWTLYMSQRIILLNIDMAKTHFDPSPHPGPLPWPEVTRVTCSLVSFQPPFTFLHVCTSWEKMYSIICVRACVHMYIYLNRVTLYQQLGPSPSLCCQGLC